MLRVIFGYDMPEYTGPLRKCRKIKMNCEKTDRQVRAIQIGPANLNHIPFYVNVSPYNFCQGVKKRMIHEFYKEGVKDFEIPVYKKGKVEFKQIADDWRTRDDFIRHMPEEDEYARFNNFMESKILPLIESLPPPGDSQQEFEDWIANYDRPEGRKNQIRSARDRILNDQSGFLNSLYIMAKCFVKNEPYEEMKYARIISPRLDEVVAVLGPAIKKAEHYIFEESPLKDYFFKHLNPDQQCEKLDRLFNSVLLKLGETDFSSFEGSYTRVFQHICEVAIFRKLFRHDPVTLKNLETLYTRTKLKCPFFNICTIGSRMSGDLWTSLMNGLSNLCIFLYLCDKKGISNPIGVFEGDDGLFAVPEADIFVPEDYKKLGFKIKIDYQDNLADCSFCQKIFSPITKNLLAPPELLNRVGWTSQRVYFKKNKHFLNQLLCMKAFSYLTLYPHCPVIAPCMVKILKAFDFDPQQATWNAFGGESWYHKWLQGLPKPELGDCQIQFEDRVLYEQRFNITIAQQILFEESFDPHRDFRLDLPMKSYDEGYGEAADFQLYM